jgi:integrase
VQRLAALYRWVQRREDQRAIKERRVPRVLSIPIDWELVPRSRSHRVRFLTPGEAARLLAATPARLRWPVAAGLLAGLRLNEILFLTHADVDRTLELLYVQRKSAPWLRGKTWYPKNRRERDVPLFAQLAPVLEAHAVAFAGERWLVPSLDARTPGRPMTDQTFARHFATIVRAAGLVSGRTAPEGVTVHTLRHTFASWLVMAKVDLLTVSRLLGHTSTLRRELLGAALQPRRAEARRLADRGRATTVTDMGLGRPGAVLGEPDLVCAVGHLLVARADRARDRAPRTAIARCGAAGRGCRALATGGRTRRGATAHAGSTRFDRQRGDYRMTFASRGCPVGCWFCIVPKIEGVDVHARLGFQPAPILCDNNLSALPVEFQEHILGATARRARSSGRNSGFEPRAFDEGTYAALEAAAARRRGASPSTRSRERADVERMMKILRAESARSGSGGYVLVGNEPIAACYERAMQVIAWGGEPYCQYVLPLNWLGDPATLRAAPRLDLSARPRLLPVLQLEVHTGFRASARSRAAAAEPTKAPRP